MTAAFERDGFGHVSSVLTLAECRETANLVTLSDLKTGGSRDLLGRSWCRELAHRLRAHEILGPMIGTDKVAVQCTYFEKSAGRNWLVALHQDLSVPVAARIDHPALKGWSKKEGAWFVHAPEEVLNQLIAVRLHLDLCAAADGPLRVVPGSHALGVLQDDQVQAERARRGEIDCLAKAGDALVLRPLLLHASSKGSGTSRRRVLHFVFGPRALPHGLSWHVSA